MNIGEPKRIETDVPRPTRVQPIRIPMKPIVRPVREPIGVPTKRGMSGRLVMYECPKCSRELEEVELADGVVLTCPEHGPVQELTYA